jgi:hypothetical protein
MSKRHCKALSATLVALGLVSVLLLTTRADGGGDQEWSTDTFPDFLQGTSDGVDIWSTPGMAHLDRAWWLNTRVNDVLAEGKVAPRVSFALTDTGGTSSTLFLAVWEDEHIEDHSPDIYFAHSLDGGHTWSPNALVSGAHQHGLSRNTPDISVRATDGSFWTVWQDDRSDDGDIYYAVSHNQGTSWASALPVYSGAGKQLTPRIAPHGGSGYLYVAWEDERDDDGDIYVSRYTGSAWTTPVKASDCISNAEQREPSLAVDADGNAYAVWLDERERDQYTGDIYFSRWISGTTWGTWSTNTRLSDPTMDYADSPDIVAGAGGLLFATWMERVPTGPATYDFQIVVARSEDNGATWERSVVHRLYNASASNASYNNPSIGVDIVGRVYVAWLHSPDQQAATANILFSLSPDGGAHWTQPRVLNRPQNNASGSAAPALMSDFDGQIVVAWEDFRGTSAPQIYATGYPADRYLSNGSYSRIFDADGLAAWGNITWTATTTPNTGLLLATRAMTSAATGWTDWVTHAASGDALSHPFGRFIQYRAFFTSTGSDTSVLDEVVISYEQHMLFLPLVLRES